METNKILSADILDIIFEGRNKDYGAYELRKTYKNRLIIAIVATLLVCLIFFIASVVANLKDDNNSELLVQDVNLEQMQQQEEKQPEPPPPPPPPKVEPPKVEITKFTPPKIVKDEEVKPEEEIKEQEVLEDTKIGSINQEGIKSDVVAPPVEEKGTGQVEAPKVETEDYDKEFTSVQIEASFPGGVAAWKRFLERNLNQNVLEENGAPPGRYTVVVSFRVDKDGSITEVKAENNPGYGTADEAVRVIKKGPKWKPAEQNGRQVIYRQRQSITFVLEGE
jgi:periplasmic protein TonB